MSEFDQIHALLSNPATWILAGWLIKEMWASRKTKDKEHTSALQQNTQEIQKLTLALAKFEFRLDHLDKAVELLPKMRNDINDFHAKIRALDPKPAGRS
jgi:hypothetical protein